MAELLSDKYQHQLFSFDLEHQRKGVSLKVQNQEDSDN